MNYCGINLLAIYIFGLYFNIKFSLQISLCFEKNNGNGNKSYAVFGGLVVSQIVSCLAVIAVTCQQL